MMKAPAFQWYPKDCDADENVRGMDDREFGFYVRCLNHAWMNDGLPGDRDELARVMHRTPKYVASVWKRVGKCFVADGEGRLRNPKQESLKRELAEYSESRKNGARARWNKQVQCTTDARASKMQCSASASATASPSAEDISPPSDVVDPQPPRPVSQQNGYGPGATGDDEWMNFREAGEQYGWRFSDTEWGDARFEWNRLDFAQKIAAVAGLHQRVKASDDGLRLAHPKNYLAKSMWMRAIVEPKATRSKEPAWLQQSRRIAAGEPV